MAEQREVNLSDVHIPYHDVQALALALKVCQVVQPTAVNLLGDMLNCSALGPFPKSPKRKALEGFDHELALWRRFAAELRRTVGDGALVRMIPGNHEDWYRRYLWQEADALANLEELELVRLMHLAEYGIEPVWPDFELGVEAEIFITPTLVAKHGSCVSKHAGMSALRELELEGYQLSTITGHTHRQGMTQRTLRDTTVYGYENGCLCRRHSREWVTHPNWQLGLSVVVHDGQHAHVDLVPFYKVPGGLSAHVWGREVRL